MASDWYDIKFLESATNVRELIYQSSGHRPSASRAHEIAVCLQQGRLFFEGAAGAPMQLKPLQIYYGIVAFAKAVVVAKSMKSLGTLVRAHGITDTSPDGSSIENLELRFEQVGTFQEFNDAIAPLGHIRYFDDNSMPRSFAKPFDSVASLLGQKVTFGEVMARIPGLESRYERTFGSRARIALVSLDFAEPNEGLCTLRIDDPNLIPDRPSLIACVSKWRAAFPFLNRWRFKSASHAWGFAILQFDNVMKSNFDDLSDVVQAGNEFVRSSSALSEKNFVASVRNILPPLSGSYTQTAFTYATEPLSGVTLAEQSLQFLGCFLLSSLVRYRPQVWQKAISRSFTSELPADDRSLSLIEQFLDDVLASFPGVVVRIIEDKRTG